MKKAMDYAWDALKKMQPIQELQSNLGLLNLGPYPDYYADMSPEEKAIVHNRRMEEKKRQMMNAAMQRQAGNQ